SNEWDQTILSKVSENYLPKSSEPLMAGQGGVKLWKFKAEKAGTVELVFTYSRPWESFQPAKTVRLTIVVDDPARMVALGSTRIVSQTAALESQLTIPVIRGMENSAAQKELNQAVQAEVLEFYESVNAQAAEDAKDAAQYEAEYGRSFLPYQAYASFTPGVVSDDIISYYLDCYKYLGGAHGMTVRSSHSIDPVSGRELGLKDFFVAGYDYVAAINEEIAGQIKADTETYYFDTTAEEAKIAADAVNFYATAQGLVFYYQQYELAPYAAGILEYTIPFELLEEGLKR
ncbi:MAG: DUF3298 domain-containing protein, partial [Syntrophomonadaceae bacterium]|nr:DUF3298 domain-containing protein [Syntrophomonadaceae bacterium]